MILLIDTTKEKLGKPVAKILTEIAVSDRRGNRLVILLLNTKRQLMAVIRDYSEMP